MFTSILDSLFKKIIFSFSILLLIILLALFIILPAYLEDYFIASRRGDLLDKGRILSNFIAEESIAEEQLLNMAEELVDTNLLVLNQEGQIIQEGSRMSKMRRMHERTDFHDRHRGSMHHKDFNGHHMSQNIGFNEGQSYDLTELSKELGDIFSERIISFSGSNPFLEEDVIGVGVTTDEHILFLLAPSKDLEDTIYGIRNLTLQIIAVAFILALLLSIFISRGITRPLAKIKEQIKRMSQGEFDVRINDLSNDEIGQLGAGFNQLSSKLKENIDSLNKEKDKMERMLQAMGEGVLGLSSDKEVIFSNQSFQDIFAVQGDKDYQELIKKVDFIADLVSDILTKKQEKREEYDYEDKIILVHGAPIISNEKLQGIIILFSDVTEMRKLDKMRELFVANVSHELKTPLTAIQGYLEALLDDMVEDKATKKRYLERSLAESNRMNQLVKEILTLAKLQADQIKFNYQIVNLNQLIEEVISDFKNRVEKKIDFTAQKELKLVTDHEKVKEVLINLLSNAIKFTDANGVIDVSLNSKQNEIEIEVKDNGVGIPKEELAYIWDRFHQVDRSRRPDVEGTGLGLAIVKEIVENLGGRVEASSIRKVGSQFKIYLPVKE